MKRRMKEKLQFIVQLQLQMLRYIVAFSRGDLKICKKYWYASCYIEIHFSIH